MSQLLVGIFLFFGMHSISIVALPLRDRLAARNELAWKGLYALVSLAGIILMVRGYAELRQSPTVLYSTPVMLRHLAALLLLPVFTLFLAPYFPGRIKRFLKHPQLIATQLWAVAHLLVNGTLGDLLLFGSFLVWAVADQMSMKRRKPRPVPGAPESGFNDVVIIVLGLGLYAAFVLWLHQMLIGVGVFA